jgi:pyrroloquinoline quinone biosynthesis protein E
MIEPPLVMIAEVTHACPLGCVYCSNPLQLAPREDELPTEDWLYVIHEAADLGVLQLHLSGGEPLQRPDLGALVQAAAGLELYTNLITSGIGLDRDRAQALAEAGLKNVQLSIQAERAELADAIAGHRAYRRKVEAAEAALAAGLTLSLNVVIHRHNIDRLSEIINLGFSMGAQRLELANAQYYGWALVNRSHLLPTREQVAQAEAVYSARSAALRPEQELIWVLPDYYEPFPKPCMGGWGRLSLTVAPDGRVLPCPAAAAIHVLRFDSVRTRSLAWIWERSPAFNAFRGFEWMPEPCRTCDRRFIDYGGCRCQAFLLTGDAARTDPVCHHIWPPSAGA